MSKFSYTDNEIEIGKYQCDFCRYKCTDTENGCSVYEKAPVDVLTNKIACDKFAKKGKKYPWEK